ncbi:MAG: hypothetical protein ACJ71B_08490, partial [Nitrososphaera sp.]
MTITLAAVTIAIILFSLTITLTSAQQQQPLTNQQAVAQNRTTQFQSTEDGIRLQIPPGWIIQDMNNTGLASSDEVIRGYGIVAQLCTEKEEQQQNLGGTTSLRNSSNSNNDGDCQRSQEDVIHIIRYPNLDTVIQAANNNNNTNATTSPTNSTTANNNNNNNAGSNSSTSSNTTNTTGATRTSRTPTPTGTATTTTITPASTTDKILSYHLQKLQQVGYHDIKILRSANMRVNLTTPADANQTISVVPAKFAQVSYTTAIEPNNTKTGYFILTYTNATAPNLGTTKGYALFYEGNHTNSTAAQGQITAASTGSSSLPPLAVRQAFGSFELTLSPQALAQQAKQGQSSAVTNTTETNATGASSAETNVTDTGAGAAEITDNGGGDGGCDSSYPDVCIPSPPPNLNCDDPGIPNDFVVVGSDPHGFDGDNDGIGCDTPGGAGGAGGGDDVGDDDGGGGGGGGGGDDDGGGGGGGDDDGGG